MTAIQIVSCVQFRAGLVGSGYARVEVPAIGSAHIDQSSTVDVHACRSSETAHRIQENREMDIGQIDDPATVRRARQCDIYRKESKVVTVGYRHSSSVALPTDTAMPRARRIGDRTPGIVYEEDGSLIITISHTEPTDATTRANWLPAPAGDFRPVLRMYDPDTAVLDGTYETPAITRSEL